MYALFEQPAYACKMGLVREGRAGVTLTCFWLWGSDPFYVRDCFRSDEARGVILSLLKRFTTLLLVAAQDK